MICIRTSVLAGLSKVSFVVRTLGYACLGICASLLVANQAAAVILVPAVVLSETFDTPAAGSANVSAAYPDYLLTTPVGTNANVVGGQLQLVKPTATQMTFLSSQTFIHEPLTVRANIGVDATSTGNGGNDAVGIIVGNRAFVIFPENGTLRPSIDTTSGSFPFQQGTGIGFARNVMHYMEVVATPNGLGMDFSITVTDGANPLNTYTLPTYFDGGYVAGPVGFMNVYSTSNVGLYDNLEVIALVEFIPPAPEPSSALLLGCGSLVLMQLRRRCRAAA